MLRTIRWLLRLLPRLLPILALSALVACSGDSSLNGNKLAQQIQKSIKDAGVTLKAIHCPNGRPLKLNDTFECTAVAKNGKPIRVQAVQINNKGNVKWNVASGLLVIGDVQRFIVADFAEGPKIDVTVKCPTSKAIAVADGDSIECRVENVKDVNDATTVKVTVKSDDPKHRGFEWTPVSG